MQCLYIDVYNPTYHVLLADAQMARKKPTAAIEEYEVALTLKPRKADEIRVKLAKAQSSSGDKAAAIATLDAILKRDPEHPEAKARETSWTSPVGSRVPCAFLGPRSPG